MAVLVLIGAGLVGGPSRADPPVDPPSAGTSGPGDPTQSPAERPAGPVAEATAKPAGGASPSADVEERLRRLEEMNQRLLIQNERLLQLDRENRARAEELERKYEELRRRVEGTPAMPEAPAANPEVREAPAAEAPAAAHEAREPGRGLPLRTRLDEGFELVSDDEEYSVRLRVLDQTDFKVFVPNDQEPARSGLYIPRVRVYFEGQLTRPFEYEVSLQRSVEGVWDLLDGNLNIRFAEGFNLRFGRTLVPYSYAWYDHLEQYFIVPERALFPLNFGLSRSAGLMAHGRLADGRLQYALGGFDGRLAGIADDNGAHEAVGYVNAKPFVAADGPTPLKNLNLGISGFLGQQVQPRRGLPLRTSLQSSENDEAASAASAIFLDTEPGVLYFGPREGVAAHLAWYHRGWSLESEIQYARFQTRKAGLPYFPVVPVAGGHVTLSYFLTGEQVEGRTTVEPLRPWAPLDGRFSPGAIEVYGRYSQLWLGEVVFTDGLADPEAWTRNVFMTDFGFNWYLNRYVKFYVEWQHANFGSPVLINPRTEKFSRYDDLFWIRCQVYF